MLSSFCHTLRCEDFGGTSESENSPRPKDAVEAAIINGHKHSQNEV